MSRWLQHPFAVLSLSLSHSLSRLPLFHPFYRLAVAALVSPWGEFAAICDKFLCWKASIKCGSNNFVACSLFSLSLVFGFFSFSFFSWRFRIRKKYAWLIIKFKLNVSFILKIYFRPLFTQQAPPTCSFSPPSILLLLSLRWGVATSVSLFLYFILLFVCFSIFVIKLKIFVRSLLPSSSSFTSLSLSLARIFHGANCAADVAARHSVVDRWVGQFRLLLLLFSSCHGIWKWKWKLLCDDAFLIRTLPFPACLPVRFYFGTWGCWLFYNTSRNFI